MKTPFVQVEDIICLVEEGRYQIRLWDKYSDFVGCSPDILSHGKEGSPNNDQKSFMQGFDGMCSQVYSKQICSLQSPGFEGQTNGSSYGSLESVNFFKFVRQNGLFIKRACIDSEIAAVQRTFPENQEENPGQAPRNSSLDNSEAFQGLSREYAAFIVSKEKFMAAGKKGKSIAAGNPNKGEKKVLAIVIPKDQPISDLVEIQPRFEKLLKAGQNTPFEDVLCAISSFSGFSLYNISTYLDKLLT